MTHIIKKQAFFIDNNENEQYANIIINEGIFIGIDTFCNNKQTGYTRIYFNPDNRFYLDAIYCLDEFRGIGIATVISELSDYIMSKYEGNIIRGAFKPTQMSTDRDNNIERSEDELDIAARRFYKKSGYEVINYEEYINNPKIYPYIDPEDFQLGEEIAKTIVAKVISKKEFSFIKKDNIIYQVDYENKKLKTIR